MRKKLLVAIVAFGIQSVLGSRQVNGWSTVRPGIEFLRGTYQDQADHVRFVAVRCDPLKVAVRVVDTFHELGGGSTLSRFCLKDIIDAGALLASNAGSTKSYSIPIPVGLLMVNGKVISEPDAAAQPHPGFFCVGNGRVAIGELASFDPRRCLYAVQRGPVLTRNIDTSKNGSLYRRTIIAVDRNNKLLIFVTSDKATLAGTATFLFSSNSLNIESALNMDGDVSSGLLSAPELKAELGEVGNSGSLLASAVVVYGEK